MVEPIATVWETKYFYGKHAVVRHVPTRQASTGLLFKKRAKQRPAKPQAKPPERRTYVPTVATRRALRTRVCAMMHYCLNRAVPVWFDSITFSNRWELTPEQTHAVLTSFNLRVKNSKTAQANLWLWVTERQKNGTLHYHLLHTDSYDVQARQRAMRKTLRRVAPHIPLREVASWNGLEHGGRAVKHGPKGPMRLKKNAAVGQYVSKVGGAVSNYLTKCANEEYAHRVWACSHEVGALPIGEAVNDADDGAGAEPYKLGELVIHSKWCSLFDYDQEATYGRAYLERLQALLEREENWARSGQAPPEAQRIAERAPKLEQLRLLWNFVG